MIHYLKTPVIHYRKTIGERVLEARLRREERRFRFFTILALAGTVVFVIACGVWGAR